MDRGYNGANARSAGDPGLVAMLAQPSAELFLKTVRRRPPLRHNKRRWGPESLQPSVQQSQITDHHFKAGPFRWMTYVRLGHKLRIVVLNKRWTIAKGLCWITVKLGQLTTRSPDPPLGHLSVSLSILPPFYGRPLIRVIKIQREYIEPQASKPDSHIKSPR